MACSVLQPQHMNHPDHLECRFKSTACIYILMPSLNKVPKWLKEGFDLIRGQRVKVQWYLPFTGRTILFLSQVWRLDGQLHDE